MKIGKNIIQNLITRSLLNRFICEIVRTQVFCPKGLCLLYPPFSAIEYIITSLRFRLL